METEKVNVALTVLNFNTVSKPTNLILNSLGSILSY